MLAFTAERAGQMLWNFRAKFHWLWHIGHRAKWLSPRKCSCWIDENFVGVMKGVVHSCGAGSNPAIATTRSIEKCRSGIDFLTMDCVDGDESCWIVRKATNRDLCVSTHGEKYNMVILQLCNFMLCILHCNVLNACQDPIMIARKKTQTEGSKQEP